MFNKIILVGRVGKDLEMRNEKAPVNFPVATSDSYKDDSGEWVEQTEWHNIVVWGTPDFKSGLTQRISKGDLVVVEGKSVTETWETESGEKRYSTKVKAFKVSKIPTGAKASGGSSGGYGDKPAPEKKADTGGYSGGPSSQEEDLPF